MVYFGSPKAQAVGQWAQVTKPAWQSTFVSGNVKIDALRPPAGTFGARYLHDPDHAGFLKVGDDLSSTPPINRLRLPRQFVPVDTGTPGIRDDLVDLFDAGSYSLSATRSFTACISV